MKLSRRQFLKVGGGTAAGLATAGVVELSRPKQASAKVEQSWKLRDARQVASICPYCAVGCATIIHARERTPGQKDWQVVNIEGHPDSPINAGTRCPKGAASFQLGVNDRRQTKALYRAAGSDTWEEKPLDWMYDRVAQLIKDTREQTFVRTKKVAAKDRDGRDIEVERTANHTKAIASLGGATMDNEWNYAHLKLLRSLGVVYLENQARI